MAILLAGTVDVDNNRITNVGTPSAAADAANKTYVDSAIQGTDWKDSVRAASTGNITLSAPGSAIDGVTMASGNRFLAKDQSTGSQNGIYVWNGAASAATRATDADTSAKMSGGVVVSVNEGTVNADLNFRLITNDPITLGTTSLSFTQMAGSSTPYLAGSGLTLTSYTFDVGAGTGITVAADAVSVDTSVVARHVASNIGNGSATTIAYAHNLGTYDVTVQVFLNSGTRDTVICEVQRTDVNTVTLVFGTAPASGAYRVVVIG